MCAREITRAEFIEFSFTLTPSQKYSVAFINGEDDYNYFHIDYVVRGLSHPFAAWNIEWTNKEQPIANFKSIGRNSLCPCGSGKKFKKCCLKKGSITTKHLNVIFLEPPPSNFAPYEESAYVRGKGSLTQQMSENEVIHRLNMLETMDDD